MAREIEPTTIAAVVQESAVSAAALELLNALKKTIAAQAFTPTELANHEAVLYERVRWAGHCANTFLDLCDYIELRLAVPNTVLFH